MMESQRIKEAREELGLTVSEFADALQLAQPNGRTTVRQWESGQKTISGPAATAIEALLTIRDLVAHGAAREDLASWEDAVDDARNLLQAMERF